MTANPPSQAARSDGRTRRPRPSQKAGGSEDRGAHALAVFCAHAPGGRTLRREVFTLRVCQVRPSRRRRPGSGLSRLAFGPVVSSSPLSYPPVRRAGFFAGDAHTDRRPHVAGTPRRWPGASSSGDRSLTSIDADPADPSAAWPESHKCDPGGARGVRSLRSVAPARGCDGMRLPGRLGPTPIRNDPANAFGVSASRAHLPFSGHPSPVVFTGSGRSFASLPESSRAAALPTPHHCLTVAFSHPSPKP